VRVEDYRETLRGHQVLHLVGKGNKPATMPLTLPALRVLETCRGTDQRAARTKAGLGQADRPTQLQPDGPPDRQGRQHHSHHISPHSLRHAAITNALDADVPL
jgi:integrase/recombinase XerD